MSGPTSALSYVRRRAEAHDAYLAAVRVICGLQPLQFLPATYEQMAPVAESDSVLPLLVSRLRDAGIRVPDQDGEGAQRVSESYARESAGQERVASLVVSSLADRDVRVMRYKGPSLGRRLFGADGLRISGDIDLIVDGSDLHKAAAVVEDLGWLGPQDPLDDQQRPRLHLELAHPGGFWPVEIHWRVHWHEEQFAADVLRRAIGDALSLAPISSDELLLLLITFARDGAQRLRGLADLAGWYRLWGDDRGQAVAAAAEAYPALSSLLRVTERIVRLRVGLDDVSDVSRWTRHERVAFWLAMSPVSAHAPQRRAELHLFDLLVAHRGERGRLLRALMWPNPEEVASWSGRPPSYRDAVAHSFRVAGRLLIALPRAWGRRVMYRIARLVSH